MRTHTNLEQRERGHYLFQPMHFSRTAVLGHHSWGQAGAKGFLARSSLQCFFFFLYFYQRFSSNQDNWPKAGKRPCSLQESIFWMLELQWQITCWVHSGGGDWGTLGTSQGTHTVRHILTMVPQTSCWQACVWGCSNRSGPRLSFPFSTNTKGCH